MAEKTHEFRGKKRAENWLRGRGHPPQPLVSHPVLSDGDTEVREAPAFFKVMAWNNEQF